MNKSGPVSERIQSYHTFCVLVSKTALTAPWQQSAVGSNTRTKRENRKKTGKRRVGEWKSWGGTERNRLINLGRRGGLKEKSKGGNAFFLNEWKHIVQTITYWERGRVWLNVPHKENTKKNLLNKKKLSEAIFNRDANRLRLLFFVVFMS